MTEQVQPTRRQQAKAATRAKLLATARDLWSAHSYEEITMRDIAHEARVSTGAIFANWSGKAQLWREAMGYAPPVDCPEVRALLQRMAQMAEPPAEAA